MKYGRLLAMAGILVTCLLGCAVRRSGSVHDNRISEGQSRYDRLYARTDARVSTSNTVAERWRDVRIVRRDYDLDKPRDEKGEYPVKSEIILEGKERQGEKKEESGKEESEEREQGFESHENSASKCSGSNSDTDVKVGILPIWWWLIGVLMTVVGLIFLRRRYGKKNQTK